MPDFAVRTAFTAVDKISPAFRNMESSASSFQKTASRAFMAIGTLVSGYLINSFVEAAASSDRLETAFNSVFGSDSANQMKFVREETKRLGLDMMSSADAYKSIAAAANGTAISNRDVQQTFLGVSEAAGALQLTSEQSQGALLAISQIISKGKVSMEELRGQLGERIPGAMRIAAKAMNVTQSELEKMVASGISAETFIPRFAKAMRDEYGSGAAAASKSFNAQRNIFNNTVFDFKVGVGSVLLPALSDLMIAFMPVIDVMGQFFRENREGISAIIKLIPWLVGGFIAWKVAMIAWNIAAFISTARILGLIGAMQYYEMSTKIITVLTKSWTLAQKALNIVMMANPIGLIVIAIAAFIGYVVVAIKHWNSFGAAMMILLGPIGMVISLFKTLYDRWEQIKQAFSTGGIVAGLKEIGFAILDSLLYPIQQLLELIAKIPGIGKYAAQAAAGIQGFREGNLNAPNKSATELQAGNTNVNIYSNGTEAKAEVTPRKGATVNMNRLGYQQ